MRVRRYPLAAPIALVVLGVRAAASFGVVAQVRGDAAEAVEVARMLKELHVETVADIGAGFGGFAARLAHELGDGVRVIATELPRQTPRLSEELRSRGASRIEVVEGAPADTNLPAASCDALIVRVTCHHFDRPAEMAASLLRTLRPGGTLLVIEQPRVRTPSGEWDGIMPAPLVEQLQQAGFVHQRTSDPFDTMWRTPLYLVMMRKP